jgi:arylsulfatase A-like enzyme
MKQLNTFSSLALIFGSLLMAANQPLRSAQDRPVRQAQGRPNVVFIFADDMGYGDVSGLNPKSHIQTPHLDRMIDEGMYFSDAHTSSSVCTPSRYSLLTGRYAWRTHMKSGVLAGVSPHLIDPDRMTVADVFKEAGYDTALIGKWHLGMDFAFTGGEPAPKKGRHTIPDNIEWTQPIKNGPNANGFDYFYGMSASLDMPPYIYIENEAVIGLPTATKAFFRKGPAHPDFEAIDVMGEFTTRTVEYIETHAGDQPFFIYMPLTAPHTPVVPSKEFQGQSDLGAYGDFCMEVDWMVGQVIAALEQKGILENTLVIFSADNGCSKAALRFAEDKMKLSPQTPESTAHHPSLIFRGSKSDNWEGGHRVPFIMQWPEGIQAGTHSDALIGLTDFMAMAAELTGVEIPSDAAEDSLSFLPALNGGPIDLSKREGIVHHSVSGHFAIRRGDWKLILTPGSSGWTSPTDQEAAEQGLPEVQLYNLAEDPSETNNLQAQYPEGVHTLAALLNTYIESGVSVKGKTGSNDPLEKQRWTQLESIKSILQN